MLKKINILISFGTRPEGIKMAPLIKEIKKNSDKLNLTICSTGQHKEMLDQVLEFFEIKPDIDLNLMTKSQSLGALSSKVLLKMEEVFNKIKPDIVLVQGDTTTAFLAALVAFYQKIKVGHIEAGLRTYNKFSPFPEEINRQLISKIADLHFAPTKSAYDNLINEKINQDTLFLTGNTIVDAINWGIKKINNFNYLEKSEEIKKINNLINFSRKTVLVTMHRRESFGEEIINVCKALKHISKKYNDINIVYPVHLNPNVRKPVEKMLSGIKNIKLIEPLSYESFLYLMEKSYFIITDSGGVQEEAPTLQKPVLVIREFTERTESLELGMSKLIGTETANIVNNVTSLIENKNEYNNMISGTNPYGDGTASFKILTNIFNFFGFTH